MFLKGLWRKRSKVQKDDLSNCLKKIEISIRVPVYRAISGNQNEWIYGYSEIWKVGLKDQVKNHEFSQLHATSRVIEQVYNE
jgi:hypothetical protein